MAFRKVNMELAAEQTVAPEGEYRMAVGKVTAKRSKKGADMDVLLLRFVDHPEYAPFSHFVVYPKPDDEEEKVRLMSRNMRRLCHLFEVPMTEEGFDSEDFSGAEAVCGIVVEKYEPEDGSEPREQNKLRLPRVPDEE